VAAVDPSRLQPLRAAVPVHARLRLVQVR
jgi:hypothetical protein